MTAKNTRGLLNPPLPAEYLKVRDNEDDFGKLLQKKLVLGYYPGKTSEHSHLWSFIRANIDWKSGKPQTHLQEFMSTRRLAEVSGMPKSAVHLFLQAVGPKPKGLGFLKRGEPSEGRKGTLRLNWEVIRRYVAPEVAPSAPAARGTKGRTYSHHSGADVSVERTKTVSVEGTNPNTEMSVEGTEVSVERTEVSVEGTRTIYTRSTRSTVERQPTFLAEGAPPPLKAATHPSAVKGSEGQGSEVQSPSPVPATPSPRPSAVSATDMGMVSVAHATSFGPETSFADWVLGYEVDRADGLKRADIEYHGRLPAMARAGQLDGADTLPEVRRRYQVAHVADLDPKLYPLWQLFERDTGRAPVADGLGLVNGERAEFEKLVPRFMRLVGPYIDEATARTKLVDTYRELQKEPSIDGAALGCLFIAIEDMEAKDPRKLGRAFIRLPAFARQANVSSAKKIVAKLHSQPDLSGLTAEQQADALIASDPNRRAAAQRDLKFRTELIEHILQRSRRPDHGARLRHHDRARTPRAPPGGPRSYRPAGQPGA